MDAQRKTREGSGVFPAVVARACVICGAAHVLPVCVPANDTAAWVAVAGGIACAGLCARDAKVAAEL